MSKPHERGDGPPVDVAPLVRQVDASNEAVEDLYLRTRQTADIAERNGTGTGVRRCSLIAAGCPGGRSIRISAVPDQAPSGATRGPAAFSRSAPLGPADHAHLVTRKGACTCESTGCGGG